MSASASHTLNYTTVSVFVLIPRRSITIMGDVSHARAVALATPLPAAYLAKVQQCAQ